jgi:hypothetical protein
MAIPERIEPAVGEHVSFMSSRSLPTTVASGATALFSLARMGVPAGG